MHEAMRRLLKRLKKGACLKRAGAGFLLSGRRGPKAVVAAELVNAALAAGLIAETPAGLALSDAGERWLTGRERFLPQHLELETRLIEDGDGTARYVVVNAAESPLSLLARRKLITAVQFEAGEKLRRDYTIGGLAPRMGVDYSAPVGDRTHRANLAETVLAARQRFNRAMAAAGPGLSSVLFDICCYLASVEECEHRHAWPRGSAKVVLALALDRLAAHYGMDLRASGRIRAWNAEKP